MTDLSAAVFRRAAHFIRRVRIAVRVLLLFLVILTAGGVGLWASAHASTPSSAGLCFVQRLPAPLRASIADDAKLLIGWAFDAAAAKIPLKGDEIVDARSSFTAVPGFAGPTSLASLKGRYKVLHPPFDRGRGYYGIALGALDEADRVTAILLVNRLFRLPIILHEPGGLATDLVTNGAMVVGLTTEAIGDAEEAADAAHREAASRGVPLITAGQSQAGGIAQLQIAFLQKQYGMGGPTATGFMTMNAAYALLIVNRLGFAGRDVAGVNFSKDLDPGVGPHAIFANRVGSQIYIHPDGSGDLTPGDNSIFSAMLHPHEHFLESFNNVSLSSALDKVMGSAPTGDCLK